MTLSDKVKGRTPLKLYKAGPGTYLTEHQEAKLTKYLIHMAQIGYGIPRKDIPDIVKKVNVQGLGPDGGRTFTQN